MGERGRVMMLELTKGQKKVSSSDEQMWKWHTIIRRDSWNKGIIQMKNILLLQYLVPVILLWSFDYRLIQYQRNLHCLWSGCKIKWPAQSHGKSLAKKGGDPTFPDSLWFLIFLGNGFWLHSEVCKRKVRVEGPPGEGRIYTQLEWGGRMQMGNVQPPAL